MNRIIGCYVFVLALAAISPALAGDAYEEGLKAALAGDYETAFEKWKPLGMQGEGDALFQLATMYHAGLGVDQSEAIAVALYHKAAEKGNHLAQEYLAAGYENGWFGLPRSEELAAYFQRKAAESESEYEHIEAASLAASQRKFAAARDSQRKFAVAGDGQRE
jgi:TPR repeat protein